MKDQNTQKVKKNKLILLAQKKKKKKKSMRKCLGDTLFSSNKQLIYQQIIKVNKCFEERKKNSSLLRFNKNSPGVE